MPENTASRLAQNEFKTSGGDVPLSGVPYRQRDLLTAGSFVNYCRDNGLPVSVDGLESLHRKGILVPVFQLFPGVQRFKKIYSKFDGRKGWAFVEYDRYREFKPSRVGKGSYWKSGGISMGGDRWLDWYMQSGHVKTAKKFQKSKPYSAAITPLKKKAVWFEYLYDKHQFIALKIIIHDRDITRTFSRNQNQQWPDEKLRGNVADFYDFLKFYFAAEELLRQSQMLLQEYYEIQFEETDGDEKAAKVYLAHHERSGHRDKMKELAEVLAEKHQLTRQQIDWWRIRLSHFSLLGESGRARKIVDAYVRCIANESRLIEAEDVNRMIAVINRFMEFLTGEASSVQQVLSRSRDPHCDVCGKSFVPTRVTQTTCGENVCVKAHKNVTKRKSRKK